MFRRNTNTNAIIPALGPLRTVVFTNIALSDWQEQLANSISIIVGIALNTTGMKYNQRGRDQFTAENQAVSVAVVYTCTYQCDLDNWYEVARTYTPKTRASIYRF